MDTSAKEIDLSSKKLMHQDEEMRELTRRLQELDEDYQKHKADNIRNFQNIYDQLLTKASLE